MITDTKVLDKVNDYVALVQANYDSRPYAHDTTFFLENTGQKYNRIISARKGFGDQRSVHAFVDNDGLLYKSAGWKAPVKEARYDLMNQSSFDAVAQNVSWSGGHLYKGSDLGQLPKGYTVADRPVVESVEDPNVALVAQVTKAIDAVKAPVQTRMHTAQGARPASKSRKHVGLYTATGIYGAA